MATRRQFLRVAGAGAAGLAFDARQQLRPHPRRQRPRPRRRRRLLRPARGAALDPRLPEARRRTLNFETGRRLRHLEQAPRGSRRTPDRSSPDSEPILCRNNDELYDRKDVDAVIVATADFQHALHGVEAVRAGRDAYVEKPMANTMADARALRKAVKETGKIVQIGTQRRSAANYQRAYEYLKSGKFGDIVVVEMTWNVNQPGRWRRKAAVETLQAGRHRLEALPAQPAEGRRSTRASISSSGCSGRIRQAFPISGSCTRSTPCTGSPAIRARAASSPTAASTCGRTAARNWDTFTGVYDYGPLDDPTKGFQVIYSRGMTNAAGDVKEYYYSNGGMLDLDKNKVTRHRRAARATTPRRWACRRTCCRRCRWPKPRRWRPAPTPAATTPPRRTCGTGWSACAAARRRMPTSRRATATRSRCA